MTGPQVQFIYIFPNEEVLLFPAVLESYEESYTYVVRKQANRMLQWTVFICLLAIIDGQPLYESNEDRDVYHVYRQEKYSKLTHICISIRGIVSPMMLLMIIIIL